MTWQAATWLAEVTGLLGCLADAISTETDEGIVLEDDAALAHVRALLPLHPPFYPKDQLTDKPERFFAAEMLREAIFNTYEQEIPYSCECQVDAFKETDEIIRIRAHIFVAHESQKGIVIGRGGSALKKVGIRARKRLEDFFGGKKVHLETRVKVRSNWRGDSKALEEFGYL